MSGVEKKKKETTGRSRAKKEKKPIQVVAVVTPDGIEGTFTPEPRKPLIVHLGFNSSEVEFNEAAATIRYDPNPPPDPEPYSDINQQYFQVNTEESSSDMQIGVEKEGWTMDAPTSQKEQKETVEVNSNPQGVTATVPIPLTSNLLTCYSAKTGEQFDVPDKTDVACFWCSYEFSGYPCFLPVKEESGVYHVYGNFCSPQCALTHLLSEHLDSHVRWERMSLLHRMYKVSGRIHPAPPRESLKKYGGPYTIEQYREIIGKKKSRIDVHFPPVVSILGTLDTKPIDFYDTSLQNTFTGGFSLDRFKAWSEQGGALRLKRSKPLKDRESTLDSCIQISVRRAGETTVTLS